MRDWAMRDEVNSRAAVNTAIAARDDTVLLQSVRRAIGRGQFGKPSFSAAPI